MASPNRWQRPVTLGALAIGIALFAITLRYVDLGATLALGRRLGLAIPLSLAVIGATHLIRTWAWSWCFSRRDAVPFLHLLRVRIAGEAISYLTISGITGDPLKAVMLADRVPGREAAASVAIERISYLVLTGLIVGVAAVYTMATQPLSPGWMKVYRAFAIAGAALAAAIAVAAVRRRSYLLAPFRGNLPRLAVLAVSTLAVYACMVSELWLILHALGVPISIPGAIAAETFSRVASFASAVIPANVGALEASSVASAAAVGLTAAGAPLALVRRIRGLVWAGAGLAMYPRAGITVRQSR